MNCDEVSNWDSIAWHEDNKGGGACVFGVHSWPSKSQGIYELVMEMSLENNFFHYYHQRLLFARECRTELHKTHQLAFILCAEVAMDSVNKHA